MPTVSNVNRQRNEIKRALSPREDQSWDASRGGAGGSDAKWRPALRPGWIAGRPRRGGKTALRVIFAKISQTSARHLPWRGGGGRGAFPRVREPPPTVSRSDRPNEVSRSPPAIRRHRLNCINIRLRRRLSPAPLPPTPRTRVIPKSDSQSGHRFARHANSLPREGGGRRVRGRS